MFAFLQGKSSILKLLAGRLFMYYLVLVRCILNTPESLYIILVLSHNAPEYALVFYFKLDNAR